MAEKRAAASFWMRDGEREIRVEGSEDLVREAMDRWLAHEGAPSAGASGRGTTLSTEPWSDRVLPAIQVRKNIEVQEFVALKEPDSPRDRLLTLAYFLEKYDKLEQYGLDQLRMLWIEAFPCESMDSCSWEDAIRDGYLERVGDGRFTLTFSGESYVQSGLVEEFRAG